MATHLNRYGPAICRLRDQRPRAGWLAQTNSLTIDIYSMPNEPILVAQSKEEIFLLPKMANRHGLIAGATGTGKTVTLQTLAENFSARGVPVFMADVKGDLAGLSQPGGNNPKILERAKELKIDDFKGEASPVVFWDVFGEQGHPVRATVSEMGPLLLAGLLELNQTQGGKGVVNILAADKLMHKSPKVYATFLLWMLSELFENLPEIGDPEKPKLVFFFDEAHLLFTDIAPAVEQKIEQMVRLIRSKGVGVYFVSQNPLDIPEVVLGQLGNRVQHALRAFTPRDQKAVKAAAQTFRQNPKLKIENVLTELAVGEALVSMLDENGSPQIVERAKIVPPRSQVGAITPDQRKQIIDSSVLAGHYEKAIDRESAYEKLQSRAEEKTRSAGAPPVTGGESTTELPQSSVLAEALGTVTAAFQPTVGPRGGVHDSFATSMAKSAMRAASSQLGRQIARGLLGGILGGSGRRR